jgi:hypothetical protein
VRLNINSLHVNVKKLGCRYRSHVIVVLAAALSVPSVRVKFSGAVRLQQMLLRFIDFRQPERGGDTMKSRSTHSDRKTPLQGWQIAGGLVVIIGAAALTAWHHVFGLVVLLASAALVFGRSVFRGL